ncbi:hypothetical protein E8E11_003504 [Didymella keratinophila]|nr:hypothetical protein E8E11_003504 [Didymella keratinophila]
MTTRAADDDASAPPAKRLCLGVKVCEFGDRFQAPVLLRASEDAFIAKLRKTPYLPSYEAVKFAYEHLPCKSLVLQALIEVHCCWWRETSDTKENGRLQLPDELPHDFLMGVALRYMHLKQFPK